MTKGQAKKLVELAARSRAAGVRLQVFDDAVLALVPTEVREQVRLAMRLKAQFSAYLHAVADAFEECERLQSESNDTPTTILRQAATKFGVREKSLDKGWIHGTWDKLNDLLELRADLHGGV